MRVLIFESGDELKTRLSSVTSCKVEFVERHRDPPAFMNGLLASRLGKRGPDVVLCDLDSEKAHPIVEAITTIQTQIPVVSIYGVASLEKARELLSLQLRYLVPKSIGNESLGQVLKIVMELHRSNAEVRGQGRLVLLDALVEAAENAKSPVAKIISEACLLQALEKKRKTSNAVVVQSAKAIEEAGLQLMDYIRNSMRDKKSTLRS